MIVAEPLNSLTTTAQMYSQIAGVLAGFAFTALLGYIRRDQVGSGAVTIVLFCTMATLVECAIQYSVLAGGQAVSGNSYSGLAIIGPSFGLAIASMFYATGLAARPFEHLKPVTTAVRILVGLVIPALVMLLVSAAVLDVYMYRCEQASTTSAPSAACDPRTQLVLREPTGLGLWLGVGVLLLAAAGLWLYRHPCTRPPKRTPILVSILVLSTVVASTVGYLLLALESEQYSLPNGLLKFILVTTAILLLVVGVLAARSCHHVPVVLPETEKQHSTAAVSSARPRRESTLLSAGIAILAGIIIIMMIAERRMRKSKHHS